MLVLLLLLAQTQPGSLHDLIRETYSFQPHLLNSEQIPEKSAALDEFWGRVKADQASYLPALRQELRDFGNPRFFLYDGAMLLLALSNTPEDRKVALGAVAHCDLRDVERGEYFRVVHQFAVSGEDTSAAAFRILEDPKFQVFIPQHSLTLGQDYALVYLLMPVEQSAWEPAAIERLAAEKDETALKSVLLLLWYAQTDAADAAIAKVAEDAARAGSVRSYAQELWKRKDAAGASAAAPESEAVIRARRLERMKAISDEALIDLDRDTMILMAKRR